LIPYIVAQVLGAIVAAGLLYFIASGKAGFDVATALASNGFAPIAIGLALTLIHLISIPVTNTSVNPAPPTEATQARQRRVRGNRLECSRSKRIRPRPLNAGQ
jgi:glycerol uptake facilitator-like aquaporin